MKVVICLFFAIVIAVSVYVESPFNVALDIVPNKVSGCSLDRISSVVAWKVEATETKFVRIYVKEVGKKERLWTEGDPVGSQKTDPWVGDGLTFILKDDKGRVLARRTIEASNCAT
ncbi:MAG: hypothetical protein QM805_10120 [Pseudomonas sp.]